MAKLNDSHKAEREKYFELGIHEVQISSVVQDKTPDNREYFDFEVASDLNDENAATASVRLWFHTDKAIGYSFSIIRGIFTHNAPEAKKDEVKAKLQKVDDTDELIKLCEKALIGKECWLQVSEDPVRTYEKDGETKPSINRNIFGYEPQPLQVSAPAAEDTKSTSDDSEENMAGF